MFLNSRFDDVDHMAIAVRDLDKAIEQYTKQLAFKLETLRETKGSRTGMRSAVLWSGGFSVVLIAATEPDSQVQRYIDKYGPGVQHVAFRVSQIETVKDELEAVGIEFATSIIIGDGLKQLFTKRDANTGMMYEFIERIEENSFQEMNIDSLFRQLELQDEC